MDEGEITSRLDALERKVTDLYRRLGADEPGRWSASSGSPEDDPELLALVRRGKKIEAIKVYRERTGAGLKEAKQAVERLEQLHRPTG